MNLLLDTHVLIWWYEDNGRLGEYTLTELARENARIWISAASVWEISIKAALGRLKLRHPAEEQIANLLTARLQFTAVDFHHAFAVRHLPLHHRDPFDRTLVVQAQN